MKFARLLLLLVGAFVVFALGIQACSSSGESNDDSNIIKCETELDCPIDYI